MAYVTPVYDRTKSDIVNKTWKAYFNVGDWVRIRDNTVEINIQVGIRLGVSIPFDYVPSPTYWSIPSVNDFNTLLANLERVRVVAGVIATRPIKTNWVAGPGEDAPDYKDVNRWEETIALIHNTYLHPSVRFGRTGVASTGSNINRNNKWRHYA